LVSPVETVATSPDLRSYSIPAILLETYNPASCHLVEGPFCEEFYIDE